MISESEYKTVRSFPFSKMIVLIIFSVLFIALYLYSKRTFNYWKVRGVKYVEPTILFGTYTNVYLTKQSRTQLAEETYWKYPSERIVGGFKSTRPELIIRDPELIKRVLVTDFVSFHHRGMYPTLKGLEPLKRHIFGIDGDIWRMLRQRITPAFTSGKLKAMFPLIEERAVMLQSRTLNAAKTNSTINARDLMARYTTDFIGACGFGIDADSLNNEESAFRKLGKNMFNVTIRDVVIATLRDMFPDLMTGFKSFKNIEGEVLGLVKEIQKQRNYVPCGRNDFIDLMLEYRNKPMEAESLDKTNPDGSPMKVSITFDDEFFAAQVFVFFGAGFETSSSSTSFTLHELAYNQDVQRKVQANIDVVLAKYDNNFCYDAIKEMTYLEWVFKEALRKFPSLGYLMRRATRKYTFKDLGFSVDEGVNIIIPVQALHMDPAYWDDPEEFRPERFHPDNFGAKQKLVFFPFGEGPRNCIGSRLGLMQSLAGLAAILSRFTVEPAPETIRHPVVEPRYNIVQGVKGGLPLIFRLRKNV